MVKRGGNMYTTIPYCFNKNELIGSFANSKSFYNWVGTRVKNKQVKTVRNGLYVSLDSMGNIHASKFEIACKITNDAFIVYHSALEYYGLATQVFNNVIVGCENKVSGFYFDGVSYEPHIVKERIQIEFNQLSNVRVSSLERTIIDCINNIDLAGGIEEVLGALEQVSYLDENKLIEVLNVYNKVLLFQKVGYILEQYNDTLMLSNSFFEYCESKLTNQVKYFLSDNYKNIAYDSKWKLMAPTNLKSIINGGL